jgi:hypothetical protein
MTATASPTISTSTSGPRLRRFAALVAALIVVATAVFGAAAPANAQTKQTTSGTVGSTSVYRTDVTAAPYYSFGKTYYNFKLSQQGAVVYRNGSVPTNKNQWVFITYTLEYSSGGAWQYVDQRDVRGYISANYNGATFGGATFEPNTQRAGYYRIRTLIGWTNTAGSAVTGSQLASPNMAADSACLSSYVRCSTGAGWVYAAR